MMWKIVCLHSCVFILSIFSCIEAKASQTERSRLISSVTFLVTVNDTWDENGCIETVKTQPLQPGKVHKQTEQIYVGSCDHGTLDFTVASAVNGRDEMSVQLTFHSSVIEDASPPTCNIAWNGTYLVPYSNLLHQSLLPGCFTMESREGYHMTYYWFYLLEWTFKDD